MTRKETAMLFVAMQEIYPKSMFSYTDKTVNVWHGLLGDIDAKLALASLEKHALTSEFPPSIAAIRAACVDIVSPTISVDEAWGQLWTLVRPPGSPSMGHDAWEARTKAVDPIVLDIFYAIGNSSIYASEERFFRQEFAKLYTGMAKVRRDEMALSPEVSNLIAEARAAIEQSSLALIGTEDYDEHS